MRDYEEFATALRREIEDMGTGRPGLDFGRLPVLSRPGPRARGAGLLRWIPAAAALIVALGVGGVLGYGAYESRRAVAEESRLLVDSVFARGLFESEAVPSFSLERLATQSLFDTSDEEPATDLSGSAGLESSGAAQAD